MTLKDKLPIMAGILLISHLFLLIFTGSLTENWWQNKMSKEFHTELESIGHVVRRGTVESPIAIFTVDYEEFLEVLDESPIIVQELYTFYAFSPDYIWGYKYTVHAEPDHPASYFYPIGKWHHDRS